ncbi:hypothetical protein [Pararhizobium arenae]|uniref:hypothetical protein n=1 Tax=Pararhizobium arenae TaxID=1856850 RepID=UPI00094B110F|nr:hypothetical protein [Pararhizobium arenae]
MADKYIRHDEPLLLPDVETCQTAFDLICDAQRIDRGSETARDLAALIIQLYKQGVHDFASLRALVGKAGQP